MKFETRCMDIIPRARETVSFRFPRPNDLVYKPGQYMLVTIKENGKLLTHPFSLSSSPTEKAHIEFTKKLTDSDYSKALRSFKKGTWAQIDAPYGTFTFQGEHQKVAMLAGGIGITPFRSICRYAADKQIDSNIVLLYGCRDEDEIAFKIELEEIQRQNPNFKVIIILSEPNDNWKGRVGFISADLIRTEISDYVQRIFYACGPPGMIKAMENVVTSMGLSIDRLKVEALAGHT